MKKILSILIILFFLSAVHAEELDLGQFDYGYDFNLTDSLQDENGNLNLSGAAIYLIHNIQNVQDSNVVLTDLQLIWNPTTKKYSGFVQGSNTSTWKIGSYRGFAEIQLADINAAPTITFSIDTNSIVNRTNTSTDFNNSLNVNLNPQLYSDDLNAYLDSSHTSIASAIKTLDYLYLRGKSDTSTALPQHYQLDGRIFLVNDNNMLYEISMETAATSTGGYIYAPVRIQGRALNGSLIPDGNYYVRAEFFDTKTSINNDIIRGQTTTKISLTQGSEVTVVGGGQISNEEWKRLTGTDLNKSTTSTPTVGLAEFAGGLKEPLDLPNSPIETAIPFGLVVTVVLLVLAYVATNMMYQSAGVVLYGFGLIALIITIMPTSG